MTNAEQASSGGDAGAIAGGATGDPRIERGTCVVLFAYDLGLSVDLDEAQRRITDVRQRESIHHKRRAPDYFKFHPAPLRVTQTVEPVAVGARTTQATVDATVFDFGAVSVAYNLPLEGPLSALQPLSDALYDHRPLVEASRRVVESLLRSIAPAVTKPDLSALVEDYAIYQIEALAPPRDLPEVIAEQAARLARILRAERMDLSEQEIEDALGCQISFGREDRAIIDWNAALLFGRDNDDVRAVLEFANVEALELRFLDDRLDDALDGAYAALARISKRGRAFAGAETDELWRIAELQMDSALLYEGVNNALKLLGDQYLARVYRLASARFHLNDWDASILRKLQTTESIYQKISDRRANRRLELLEWIIILLIAVSILMPFIPGLSGK